MCLTVNDCGCPCAGERRPAESTHTNTIRRNPRGHTANRCVAIILIQHALGRATPARRSRIVYNGRTDITTGLCVVVTKYDGWRFLYAFLRTFRTPTGARCWRTRTLFLCLAPEYSLFIVAISARVFVGRNGRFPFCRRPVSPTIFISIGFNLVIYIISYEADRATKRIKCIMLEN